MPPIRLREAAIALAIALATSLAVVPTTFDSLHGLSIDILTMLRWRAFGNAHAPDSSPAVVVALDEETFRTPPFEGTPSVTWTREIGRVLGAILEGGAGEVGFDVIFPTSIEQSAVPFGDETLGARVRGFDRDYLRALALGARAGKVVLGAVQHQDKPVQPSPGQRAAVGQGANIRLLNVYEDPDEVIRRLPLKFQVDGQDVPSMAAELAARVKGPRLASIGTGGGAVPGTITLNFDGGADAIPTYSLVDLHACVEKGDKDFFRRAFAGRVVLIGTLLDVEDRKITSKRFATAPEGVRGARCALPAAAGGGQFVRGSIAGVYIHATAVNNLLRDNALIELGRPGTAILAFVLSGIVAAAALIVAPLTAAFVLLVVVAAWIAGATAIFTAPFVLPVVEPPLAALAALGITVGYRFAVSDRDKRLLRQSFSLYLAPALIEKMMASNKPPALGGEIREVTVYFSDIANFSSLSERTAPRELVAAMNEYLSAMTDVIEGHGGFVDKYIGDAIVAVFGAPLDDPDHAAHAVSAALECAALLPRLDRVAAGFSGQTVRQRIGINSGEALVGNIGSRRRFNYTVMGDMVNVAARLEGANKFYDTIIMVSEATVALARDAFAWRELDTIQVKGRAGAFTVYEPLARAGALSREQEIRVETYADALARFRARDFSGAVERFAKLAAEDAPSARFLARARNLLQSPPGAAWSAVHVLDEK